jgi:hypothetical protein
VNPILDKEQAMFVPTTQVRRYGHIAMIAIGGLLSFSALAGESEAQARYRQEAAFCKSGQSQQDYATCMREAGAARQENSRNNLSTASPDTLARNSEDRCGALSGDDRLACQARMEGMGRTTGSVEGGGVLREITIVKQGE